MKISKNFSLEEFLVSQTAIRHGKEIVATDVVKENLIRLVETCLQPIRDEFNKPLVITSGYRPEWLNVMIGGSKTSAHMDGRAADFIVVGLHTFDAATRISEMELPFDQLIHEFPDSPAPWIHLGIAKINIEPRKELLTAEKIAGMTMYQKGIKI